MLVGEIEAAIDSAEAAFRLAEESGHFHTRIAAEVNLSHMFERRAEFGHAKHHIDRAFRCVGDNRHLARAVRDSWANLLITSGDYEASKEVLAEAGRQQKLTLAYGRIGMQSPNRFLCHACVRLRVDGLMQRRNYLRLSRMRSSMKTSGWRRRILINRSKCKALAGDRRGALEEFTELWRFRL